MLRGTTEWGRTETILKKFGTKWDMTRLHSHLPEDASLMTGESGLQNNVRELQGANMDIDLTSEKHWLESGMLPLERSGKYKSS